jgi:hypothetical protein
MSTPRTSTIFELNRFIASVPLTERLQTQIKVHETSHLEGVTKISARGLVQSCNGGAMALVIHFSAVGMYTKSIDEILECGHNE